MSITLTIAAADAASLREHLDHLFVALRGPSLSPADQRAIDNAKANAADDAAREALQESRKGKTPPKAKLAPKEDLGDGNWVDVAPKTAEPEVPEPAAERVPEGERADGAAADEGVPDYSEVAAAINKLAASSRALAVSTLSEFGAKNGKELKPEQYGDFIARAAEVLA